MKPLLSAKLEDIKALKYPLFASPKYDGIRALVINGKVYSRTLKLIRQPEVQRLYSNLEGMDGELIFGNPTDPLIYNKSNSYVMTSYSLPPASLKFFVFDMWNMSTPFYHRYQEYSDKISTMMGRQIESVPQFLIHNEKQLLQYEEATLIQGYEGIMLRSPDGIYKNGRSTFREGYLIKVKRFEDGEAKILDFEELNINNNEAVKDALGYQKRSSSLEGKIGGDTLGALIVQDTITQQVFGIGSGFSDSLRKYIWNHRSQLTNTIVKYKHFPYGKLEKPRQPIFLGFRDPIDIVEA